MRDAQQGAEMENQDEGRTGIEKIAKPGCEDDSPILFRRRQGSA